MARRERQDWEWSSDSITSGVAACAAVFAAYPSREGSQVCSWDTQINKTQVEPTDWIYDNFVFFLSHIGPYWTMLDHIIAFLTFVDYFNWFEHILTSLKNFEQFWTILHHIWQFWTGLESYAMFWSVWFFGENVFLFVGKNMFLMKMCFLVTTCFF